MFVEQNDDHIDDMEISFLDYEYFEYDVEDSTKSKMIVRNICNDTAKTTQNKQWKSFIFARKILPVRPYAFVNVVLNWPNVETLCHNMNTYIYLYYSDEYLNIVVYLLFVDVANFRMDSLELNSYYSYLWMMSVADRKELLIVDDRMNSNV